MQILVKIPDEEYKRLTYIDMFKLRGYIENGVLLPKGHGELIDSRELIKKWDNLSVRGRTEFEQVIMCMPPIIEADRENEVGV